MTHPAIDQILAALRVDVREFAICEFASDTAIEIPPLDKIEVHFVLSGIMHLATDPEPARAMPPGSVVLVPPGVRQVMGSSPNPTIVFRPAETCGRRRDGLLHFDAARGSKGVTVVACGQIRADLSGAFGPFEGLVQPIYSSLAAERMVPAAFETMLDEAQAMALGSRALLGSLMKSCLILAIRRVSEAHGSASTLPGLFERPSLARAVAQVIEDPSVAYTVEDLARSAGMSRSKFAKEFLEAVGSPPMEFVARTRLGQARDLLLMTPLPISKIANRVGFASRSHFSRAFRNAFGLDPTRMRRASERQVTADAR